MCSFIQKQSASLSSVGYRPRRREPSIRSEVDKQLISAPYVHFYILRAQRLALTLCAICAWSTRRDFPCRRHDALPRDGRICCRGEELERCFKLQVSCSVLGGKGRGIVRALSDVPRVGRHADEFCYVACQGYGRGQGRGFWRCG